MTTQEQLDELMSWEKVYAWAKEHKQAPFLVAEPRYQSYDALGIAGNPLFCPLACYINGATDNWPEWRVRRGQAYRFESIQNTYYPLPEWAKKTEELVDEVAPFIGITQEMFVAILEAVKPRSEVQP